MRVVGEDRFAAFGARARDDPRDDPGIARARRSQRGRQAGQEPVGRGQRSIQVGRGRAQGGRPAGRIGRPHLVDLTLGEPRRQARAEQLVAPIAGQPERNELTPEQAVDRGPGRGAVAQRQELRRQGAGMAVQVSVDPGGIGLEEGAQARREQTQALLGLAPEAQGAHQPVAGQGPAPHDLGQPAGAEPPHGVHLPQPVLGMDETEGESGVLFARRANGHHPVVVAQHLDRGRQASEAEPAVGLGQRACQPEPAAARGQDEQGRQNGEPAPKPGQAAGHRIAPSVDRGNRILPRVTGRGSAVKRRRSPHGQNENALRAL